MKFQQFAWVDLQKCWSNGGDQFINFFGSKFIFFSWSGQNAKNESIVVISQNAFTDLDHVMAGTPLSLAEKDNWKCRSGSVSQKYDSFCK